MLIIFILIKKIIKFNIYINIINKRTSTLNSKL